MQYSNVSQFCNLLTATRINRENQEKEERINIENKEREERAVRENWERLARAVKENKEKLNRLLEEQEQHAALLVAKHGEEERAARKTQELEEGRGRAGDIPECPVGFE